MEQNDLNPFKILNNLETYIGYHLARMYWVHLSVPDVTLIS